MPRRRITGSWQASGKAIQFVRELAWADSNAKGNVRIIRDSKRVYDSNLSLAIAAQSEVLMAILSDDWLASNPSFWVDIRNLRASADHERSEKRETKFRLLIPAVGEKDNPFVSSALDGIQWREVSSAHVNFAIYDRKEALLTDYSDRAISENAKEDAKGGILTTNAQTVQGLISIFDALWLESERTAEEEKLKKREQEISRQARLMQDILAHDIRNYNQIVRLAADVLRENMKGDEDGQRILQRLQNAVDGSTSLLEKATSLGRVLADEGVIFRPVNLLDSIRKSLATVRKAQAQKEIIISLQELFFTGGHEEPYVVADDLLNEVFTNVISNSVKYTDSQKVYLDIKVEEIRDHPLNSQLERTLQIKDSISSGVLHSSYWKISLSDKGRGIPDNSKNQVFARYLANASGSGLGMSIVHALVIERYKGKIALRNRIGNDYGQGTVVEIWLPKAG